MRLLLVEDNLRLRKSLLDYLREEGFAVDEAINGEEALYKLKNWNYDAVVLDVMMRAPDGFSVLETLRADGKKTLATNP